MLMPETRPDSGLILQEGRNCWRLAHARRAAFLVDGEAYFGAFARAVERAEKCVFISAWDINSRVRLRPGEPPGPLPDELGPFLLAMLDRRRDLHVYVLDWDYSVVYALERDIVPLLRFDWRAHGRLHFRWDGEYPPGTSQHQKVVVVDDKVAFAGGFDLASSRWDTSRHLPGDPRRVNVWGRAYAPHHDVQMIVDGEAAAALASLMRRRWRLATGRRLKPVRAAGDPWPEGLRPDLEDVIVAISRTQPAWRGSPEVREIEALHLDAIAAARRSIYIENQYFTSTRVAAALGARLEERDGPDVVLVLPCACTGWLEESTMGIARARVLRKLREHDRHGRLRAYFPVVPGLGSGQIVNIHSKVLVIDDRLVKVGSANASNRSLGADRECDLAIESRGDPRVERAIARFRNGLLSEYLDVSPDRMAERLEEKGSLVAAVEACRGAGRTLEPCDMVPPEVMETILPERGAYDPEQPISADLVAREFLPADVPKASRVRMMRMVVLLAALCLLGAAWRFTDLWEWVRPSSIVGVLAPLRDSPAAPLAVLGAYVAAAFLMVPLTLLVVATLLAFGPLVGAGYAFAGALASALLGYLAGKALWRDVVRRLAGRRLNRISRRLARRGALAVAAVRLVPIAPYTVVNLVCGASHIRLRDYLLGTAMALVPGIMAIALFLHGVRAAVRHPLAALIALLIGILLVLPAVRLRRSRSDLPRRSPRRRKASEANER
jgi:phospholipase D1/2